MAPIGVRPRFETPLLFVIGVERAPVDAAAGRYLDLLWHDPNARACHQKQDHLKNGHIRHPDCR
ncbi:hypothetical protein EMIT0P2_30351 [Pseudomonas sp. IT-P2]